MNRGVWSALALAGVACLFSQSATAQSGPPAGAALNQFVPGRDAQGRYLTPNVDLSRDETSWHVRAALNVAALGCRDEAERETVAAYNHLLARNHAVLAAADAGVKAQYRARYGARWEGLHDRDMTRVYNFFAQPPAQPGFCATAHQLLAEADMVAPQEFAAFAQRALPRLEQSFTDFYRDYDAWRQANRGRQGGEGTLALRR